MSERSENPERSQVEEVIEELRFSDVRRGDRITVITSQELGREDMYTITVTGVRKDGLRIVLEADLGPDRGNLFTARVPGVLNQITGLIPGVLRVSGEGEDNRFYVENLKRHADQERISSSMSTSPIRRMTIERSIVKV